MAWVLVAGLVALAVLAAAFWLLVLEPANFGTLFRAQGVKVVPLLRLPLLDLFRYSKQDRVMEFFREYSSEFGHVYAWSLGPLSQLVVNDPELLKDVLRTKQDCYHKSPEIYKQTLRPLLGDGLLMSEDPVWKKQRKLLAPAFHYESLKSMVALMSNVIGRSLEQWRAAVPAGERALVVDTQHAISEITLRVVAVAAFGPTFLDSEEVQRVVKNAFVFVLNELQRRGTLGLSVVPVLKDLPTPGLRRLREGCAQIEALVRKVVRERREGRNLAINGHDLLDILLDAREESDPQRAMSERQIVDEAITFVFAAFETTSNHFQWLLAVLLAPENAAHLRRCREEVAAVLGARAPTYEDLKRLEFCDAVVHEALRLWPPAPFISKYAVEDHYIGPAERPIFVPKGTNISINAFVVNRRPEFWPEPDAFRPERWLGRDEARQHPFCFLSFSGGKRQCLGKNFALLQSKTLLAMLLQQFELEMLPGQRVAAGLEKINMVPKYPLLVRAAPRAAL